MLPDGSRPAALIMRWGGWVTECVDMMDSECAFVSLPASGGRDDQPAIDMSILRAIRAQWAKRLDAKMKAH